MYPILTPLCCNLSKLTFAAKQVDHFRRTNYRHDFKINEVAPIFDPFLQKDRIVSFHDLKTPIHSDLDPAIYVVQAAGHKSPSLGKALVNRSRIAALEMFDDHEKHGLLRCCLLLLSECFSCLSGNRCKSLRLFDCHVSENLAVKLDAGEAETVNELRILHVI